MRKMYNFKYILYLQRKVFNPHITVVCGNMGVNFSLKIMCTYFYKKHSHTVKTIKKFNLEGRYMFMGKMGKIIGTLAIAVVTAIVKNISDD